MSVSSTRWVSITFIVLGALFVLSSIVFTVFGFPARKTNPQLIPDQIAGFSLAEQMTGSAAVDEFTQLHGKTIRVPDGAKGIYGKSGELIVWVAVAETTADASSLVVDMDRKIAAGRSPFTFVDPLQDGERIVYRLDGMGQSHSFFQSGKNVIWLSAKPELFQESLQQVLEFYR